MLCTTGAKVVLVVYLNTVGYTQQLEGNKNGLEGTICAKVLLVGYLRTVQYTQQLEGNKNNLVDMIIS